MSKKEEDYEDELRSLQIGLVHYQQWAMAEGDKAIVVLEGRDGAGKDGAIARIRQHMAPRNTRVVALPKPSDRDRTEWWFQRYVEHLPAAGEFVLFNRSWYNRAGVEVVMRFSTHREQEDFLRDAPTFEQMLTEANIRIVKFWLDISKTEQAKRLDERRSDPVKALKVSEMDDIAQKKWKDYSRARDKMLIRTHTAYAPWTIVHTDSKKKARLAIIQHILHTFAPADIRAGVPGPDHDVLYKFEEAALTDGRLEH
ncbi:MAG TPA: polyphosphate kinase 2 [Caulobacteraceae bacterium]|nr:polyphosphate kinase 2 [Caulobacteraceae bacterium]